MAWGTSGICDSTFAHLRFLSNKAEEPTAAPIVHNETTAPVLPKDVPLQKELLVNTSTEDEPETRP